MLTDQIQYSKRKVYINEMRQLQARNETTEEVISGMQPYILRRISYWLAMGDTVKIEDITPYAF